METQVTDRKKDVAQLLQNYLEMDEAGKEKLKKVSKQVLNIWNTVNEKNRKPAFVRESEIKRV